MINCKVDETNHKYFFETTELIKICPKCKREYKSRKGCLNCKTPTRDHEKHRTGWITKDLKKFSCSCIFGSWFRWGKHWEDNYPKSRCKHCSWAMQEIEAIHKRL